MSEENRFCIELKLRQNTQEALDLVDRLCEQTQQQQSLNRSAPPPLSNNTAFASPPITNGNLPGETISSNDNGLNVDSIRINSDLMKDPMDCIMLPEKRLLVLDDEWGLMLMCLETRSVQRAMPTAQWRHPICATYIREAQHILVLTECPVKSQTPASTDVPKAESNGAESETRENHIEEVLKSEDYDRFICRFDLELKFINRIEAPKYIRDKVVSNCRMCYTEATKCIYLAVSTPTEGLLYELNSDCQWTETYGIRGHHFMEIQSFAVVGPVTELLLVESKRNYVFLLSVYASKVVNKRMVAVSERPGSLAVDEQGNLFVFDKATSKVGQHSRVHYNKIREVAVVDRAQCHISAAGGLLALLSRNVKELKIYRYN
ncbi:hypothetical protein Ddc_06280 [Ditylenchus destructor]|nr:hypothetical protein Ddc_06280 [Ditylenchus destructor]